MKLNFKPKKELFFEIINYIFVVFYMIIAPFFSATKNICNTEQKICYGYFLISFSIGYFILSNLILRKFNILLSIFFSFIYTASLIYIAKSF